MMLEGLIKYHDRQKNEHYEVKVKRRLEELKKQYNKIVNKPNDKEIIDQLIDFKEVTAKIQILEEILGKGK